jgi:cell division septal protein FtsQ
MAVTRNPNLGPSTMRAKKRRLFFIRLSIVLFILAIIIFGLAIYSGYEKVIVKDIFVSGNASVSTDTILSIANRDMTGRYGYLFSKKNFLIFPRFEIKEDILNENPAIKDVSVSWAGWQKISIVITERKPSSVWCGNDIATPDAKCYFVDKDGLIYSEASTFSGNMFVRDYGPFVQLDDVSTTSNPISQHYLPAEIYPQIFRIIDLLRQKNLKVLAVYFDGSGYKFKLETGPEIIFDDKSSFSVSFNNLFSAIETKTLDLINDASVINYVDLRFDNKVVVGKKETK